MKSTPPFIAQERSDSCAVACVRMLLAHRAKEVTEDELVQAIQMPAGGLNPEQVAELAKRYGLEASERHLDENELGQLVEEGRLPIIFFYRLPIDRVAEVHAAIPLRFSRYYVTLLDPLRGERRVSRRKLEEARRLVGRWAVVVEIVPELS